MTIINEVKRIVEEVMLLPFIYASEYNINEQVAGIADQLPAVAMARQASGTIDDIYSVKDSMPCLLFFFDLTDGSADDQTALELDIAAVVSAQKAKAKQFLRAVAASDVIVIEGAETYTTVFDKFDSFTSAGIALSVTIKELVGDVECLSTTPDNTFNQSFKNP